MKLPTTGEVKTKLDEATNVTIEYCSYERAHLWGLQKALAFRNAVISEETKFRYYRFLS